MIQTPEIGQKPHFQSDLGSLGPNSGCQYFFKISSQTLFQAIILCYLKEYQRMKLEKISKKAEFGPDFDPFGPNLGPETFFRGF